jgi:hypothetical protein
MSTMDEPELDPVALERSARERAQRADERAEAAAHRAAEARAEHSRELGERRES